MNFLPFVLILTVFVPNGGPVHTTTIDFADEYSCQHARMNYLGERRMVDGVHPERVPFAVAACVARKVKQ
ncbi:MAG: hypothetical protein U1E60_14705 [Reyranellaceae bacterium]